MITATVLIGVVGVPVFVVACFVDDRTATAATQTTAARDNSLTPVASRAAVHQPRAGRHRR